MASTPTLVKCPTCGKSSAWVETNPYRPFCSDRCRLIDLGAWMTESYTIPAEPAVNPEDEGDLG